MSEINSSCYDCVMTEFEKVPTKGLTSKEAIKLVSRLGHSKDKISEALRQGLARDELTLGVSGKIYRR